MIDAHVELFHGGAWEDITSDVDMRTAITITHGATDEHADPSPTTLKLLLDNTLRRYSPLDPLSPLYGEIGLNTPIRVRVGAANKRLVLPGVSSAAEVSTPDHASLHITGDMDVRADVEPVSWRPLKPVELAGRYLTVGDQRSWLLRVEIGGWLSLMWSPNGTFAGLLTATSTAAIPDGGRLAVRATIDVNNGAGGRTITFYTAPTMAGPWTQLGSTVVQAGTTSIFAGTAPLEVGAGQPNGVVAFGADAAFSGYYYGLELRSGLAGTVVADPDFTADPEVGVGSFTDGAGRVWTLDGFALIEDTSIRCHTGVISWTPRWDETTLDATCEVEAAGLIEQLKAINEPLRSSLYRDLHLRPEVVAYYPLEGGKTATRFSSGLASDQTAMIPYGDVTPAAHSDFESSEPLPEVRAGIIHGILPPYTGAANQRIAWLLHIPDGGLSGERVIFLSRGTGTLAFWAVLVNTVGQLKVQGYNQQEALVFDSGYSASGINGLHVFMSLWLFQNGANVDWQLSWFTADADIALTRSGTRTNATYGVFTAVQVGSEFDVEGTAYGHVTLFNDDVHTIWDVVLDTLDSRTGESAVDRFARLTREEDVPATVVGDGSYSESLGPQQISTLLDLLITAVNADEGILGELRFDNRLFFRPVRTLYNQDPKLTLDMTDGAVLNPFDPPFDTQGITNDVTVSRLGGDSVRLELTSGPLSVASPLDTPPGIGRRKTGREINVATDDRLIHHAQWALRLGTVSAHRLASLQLEMEHHDTLTDQVLALSPGDMIQLDNPPDGLPPGSTKLLVLGWSETISMHRWRWTANLAPGDAWDVGSAGDAGFRAAPTASATAAAFTSGTSTSMSVATTAGPLWTTNPADMPMDIEVSGVRLRVTAVTGASSPQTFTVQAAPVNGVAKVIPVGSPVTVHNPLIAAL